MTLNFHPGHLAQVRHDTVAMTVWGTAVALTEGDWGRYADAGNPNDYGIHAGEPVLPPLGYGHLPEPDRVTIPALASLLGATTDVVQTAWDRLLQIGAITVE